MESTFKSASGRHRRSHRSTFVQEIIEVRKRTVELMELVSGSTRQLHNSNQEQLARQAVQEKRRRRRRRRRRRKKKKKKKKEKKEKEVRKERKRGMMREEEVKEKWSEEGRG